MEGFLIINKPKDITSYACIKYIKKLIPTKEKIGHAGTLDPFATGLLIIGIGRNATKNLSLLMKTHKEYIATAKLGILTNTLDKTGTVMHEEPLCTITRDVIQKSLDSLCPSYVQTPPAYSALKYKGKPLYEWIRQQNSDQLNLAEVLKKKAKKVSIYHTEIMSFEFPYFTIKAAVSLGTYIRSLLNDIAQNCGTYATTWELQRTKNGTISLDQAIDLQQVKKAENIEKNLIPVEEFLECFQVPDLPSTH
jgi:tRNA pseudouridine55 synthase